MRVGSCGNCGVTGARYSGPVPRATGSVPMTYTPPAAEQLFVLKHVARIGELADHAEYADATPDMVEAIVEGAGALAAGEFAPLNRSGDEIGAKWSPAGGTMPPGFRDAYRAYVEGGWGTLAGPKEFGGEGPAAAPPAGGWGGVG